MWYRTEVEVGVSLNKWQSHEASLSDDQVPGPPFGSSWFYRLVSSHNLKHIHNSLANFYTNNGRDIKVKYA